MVEEVLKTGQRNALSPEYNQALRGNGAEHFNRTWTSSTERIALEEW